MCPGALRPPFTAFDMADLTLSVPTISCGHCKATIEKAVGEVPGVRRVSVDVARREVDVDFKGEPDAAPVVAAVERSHSVAGHRT